MKSPGGNKLPGLPSRSLGKKRKLRRVRGKPLPQRLKGSADSPLPVSKLKPNSQRIIARLPIQNFGELRGTWKNCVAKLADKNDSLWHESAEEILTAIEAEWDRRSRMMHPNEFFEWPSAEAEAGNSKLVLDLSVSDGMLSYLDYRVGRTSGEIASIRQSILSRVFEGRLPPVFPQAYMSSWGDPKSATRLRKLAESIASFVRNAKRRRDYKMDDAIRDWESDLKFLYDRYYLGYFSFAWPLTRT